MVQAHYHQNFTSLTWWPRANLPPLLQVHPRRKLIWINREKSNKENAEKVILDVKNSWLLKVSLIFHNTVADLRTAEELKRERESYAQLSDIEIKSRCHSLTISFTFYCLIYTIAHPPFQLSVTGLAIRTLSIEKKMGLGWNNGNSTWQWGET